MKGRGELAGELRGRGGAVDLKQERKKRGGSENISAKRSFAKTRREGKESNKKTKKRNSPNRGIEPRATRHASVVPMRADNVSHYTNSDTVESVSGD